jgi:putative IMPACT (imprinted ancient) family translation regulator
MASNPAVMADIAISMSVPWLSFEGTRLGDGGRIRAEAGRLRLELAGKTAERRHRSEKKA